MAKIPYLVLVLLLSAIFINWFTADTIIGGDWPYYFNETLESFPPIPPSWSSLSGNGLGGEIIVYPLTSYVYIISWLFVDVFSLPWELASKIFFFGLFLALSAVGSILLLKKFTPSVSPWQKSITALIYTTNTYILMVVGGGQMGVALAYAVSPIVLNACINFIQAISNSHKESVNKDLILFVLITSIQIMFDARIAYIIGLFEVIFILIYITYRKISLRRFVGYTSLAGLLLLFLQSYWLFPILATWTTPPAIAQTQNSLVEAFRFFSFAEFHHSFSLLHPNWPDNVFGKSYLMRTEFLVLPIVAFFGLFYVKKLPHKQKIMIFYLAIIAVLAAFLSKGAMEPLENINIWLYQSFPGFSLFRDATKFYVITAMAYSILIPLSLSFVFKKRSKAQYILFTVFWLYLLLPVWKGELNGTFIKKQLPAEYTMLKEFIRKDESFFRTLWIPRQHRFAFYENNHPSVEAFPLFDKTDIDALLSEFDTLKTQELLEHLSVRYIIVPYDIYGEIFQNNREYDQAQFDKIVNKLNSISWLTRVNKFNNIAVFEMNLVNYRFTLQDGSINAFNRINSTSYEVTIANSMADTLLFNERYNDKWTATVDDVSVPVSQSTFGTIELPISSSGSHNVSLTYQPEKYYVFGRYISVILFLGMISYLVYFSNQD